MDSNLYQAVQQLPAGKEQVAQLYRIAVAPPEPHALAPRLRKMLLLVAGLLVASGLIFWVAANWQAQPRWVRLWLIQGVLLLSVLVACMWPRLRPSAMLCATLVLGGLLAFVGQTYQTGADAWQLFAAWAALSLIWVLVMRSDWLWLLWVLIAATGIVMWTGRLELWQVWRSDADAPLQWLQKLLLWTALAVLPALLSYTPLRPLPAGMGWWSHRVALGCALAAWTGMGAVQMMGSGVLNLQSAAVWGLVAAVLALSLRGRFQDFVCVSLSVLALNVLVLTLAAAWLGRLDWLSSLLLFGLLTLGCVGASVRWLVDVQRRFAAQGGQA